MTEMILSPIASSSSSSSSYYYSAVIVIVDKSEGDHWGRKAIARAYPLKTINDYDKFNDNGNDYDDGWCIC